MKKMLLFLVALSLLVLIAACSGPGIEGGEAPNSEDLKEVAAEACEMAGDCPEVVQDLEQKSEELTQNIDQGVESAKDAGQQFVEGTGDMVAAAGENAENIGQSLQVIADASLINEVISRGWHQIDPNRWDYYFPPNGSSWQFTAVSDLEIVNWGDLVFSVDGVAEQTEVTAGQIVVVTTFEKFGGNPRIVVMGDIVPGSLSTWP